MLFPDPSSCFAKSSVILTGRNNDQNSKENPSCNKPNPLKQAFSRNRPSLANTLSHLPMSLRSPGGVEVHNESHGSSASDWPAAFLRHSHVCHHRGGVLHGQIPHHLLQDRHWWERQLGCGACLCDNTDYQLSWRQDKLFSSQLFLCLLRMRTYIALHMYAGEHKWFISCRCTCGSCVAAHSQRWQAAWLYQCYKQVHSVIFDSHFSHIYFAEWYFHILQVLIDRFCYNSIGMLMRSASQSNATSDSSC